MHNFNDPTADSAPLPALLTASMIRTRLVPIGKRTFFRWIAAGNFPAADVRIGTRTFWTRERVLAWMEEHSNAAATA